MVLHDEDCSEQEINRKVDCSKTAVHTAIPNFQNSRTFNDKERSGCPRKTSAKDDHLMKHSATRSTTSSYKDTCHSASEWYECQFYDGFTLSETWVWSEIIQTMANCSYKIQVSGNMKPGQLKTGAKFCFHMNLLWNSLLCIKKPLVRFGKKNPIKTMKHPQARWFGAPCPHLQQLDSTSCLLEQRWMVQGMWKYSRCNWNCICTFVDAKYLCMMRSHATGPGLFRIFLKINVATLEQPRKN